MPRKAAPPPTPESPAIYDAWHSIILTPCAPDRHFQLLVATILSAQCTDKRKHGARTVRALPHAGSTAANQELEEVIGSTGFSSQQNESLIGMSAAVAEQHAGRIPTSRTGDAAGCRPKTANVVLGTHTGRTKASLRHTHVTRVATDSVLPKRPTRSDRTGPDWSFPARSVDDARPSLDRARANDLRSASAQVRDLFSQRHLPVVAGLTLSADGLLPSHRCPT